MPSAVLVEAVSKCLKQHTQRDVTEPSTGVCSALGDPRCGISSRCGLTVQQSGKRTSVYLLAWNAGPESERCSPEHCAATTQCGPQESRVTRGICDPSAIVSTCHHRHGESVLPVLTNLSQSAMTTGSSREISGQTKVPQLNNRVRTHLSHEEVCTTLVIP